LFFFVIHLGGVMLNRFTANAINGLPDVRKIEDINMADQRLQSFTKVLISVLRA
jgi:hypothetical protein